MDDPIAYLRADPVALMLRDQGFSMEVIERVVERLAIVEHHGRLGPVEAALDAVAEVDAIPAKRRWAPAAATLARAA